MQKVFQGVAGCFTFSDPEIYVDNQARNRSGHMSHAMVEYAPGKLLAFNSNCSPERFWGHSAFGWIELRRSFDYGKTWDEPRELPFAKQAFLNGLFTISVEKAVVCDGVITAFCLRNDMLREICCEPWRTPMYIRSFDGGVTWSEPQEISHWKGRIYDAVSHNGSIYALEFCNDAEIAFTGNRPEHQYRLFRSDDRGKSFYEYSVIPFDTDGRAYGAIQFISDSKLLAYAYNIKDEFHLDTAMSHDEGRTWKILPPGFVAKGIRNPQTTMFHDGYLLHGRAANGKGFVFYTSCNGCEWDDGFFLDMDKSCCYYSNNLLLRLPTGKERLLVQYSELYQSSCVNVMHLWVD